MTAADAQIRENFYIEHYSNLNYTCLNIAPAGSIGSVGYKWTKENCIAEARKYKKYNDFLLNSPSCVSVCRKNGWLSEFTWLKRDIEYWTDEECLAVASKYVYLYDFMFLSLAAGSFEQHFKILRWESERNEYACACKATFTIVYLNAF